MSHAMGGEPIMAIAILGWPINLVPPEVAQAVLEGSRQVCAGWHTLAGGHSIDCPEPVFGLAVTGKLVKKKEHSNKTIRQSRIGIVSNQTHWHRHYHNCTEERYCGACTPEAKGQTAMFTWNKAGWTLLPFLSNALTDDWF